MLPEHDPADSRLSYQLQCADYFAAQGRFRTWDDPAMVAKQAAERAADKSFRVQGILCDLDQLARDLEHQRRISVLTEEQRAWCERFASEVKAMTESTEAFWRVAR